MTATGVTSKKDACYSAAGIGSPHFASALAIKPIASGSLTDRATLVSRINMLRDLSSIFFSRKDSGLDIWMITSALNTSAISSRLPPFILSEFSLNRSFQSWAEHGLPEDKYFRRRVISL